MALSQRQKENCVKNGGNVQCGAGVCWCGKGNSTSIPLSAIPAIFISQNNPVGTRNSLVSAGIVANKQVANNMSEAQLANALYNFYLSKGSVSYANLLTGITPLKDGAGADNLVQAVKEIKSVSAEPPMMKPIGQELQLFGSDWLKNAWNGLIGQSVTETAPSTRIVTTTKASPLTIALILGGVLVLGIMAYVIIKR